MDKCCRELGYQREIRSDGRTDLFPPESQRAEIPQMTFRDQSEKNGFLESSQRFPVGDIELDQKLTNSKQEEHPPINSHKSSDKDQPSSEKKSTERKDTDKNLFLISDSVFEKNQSWKKAQFSEKKPKNRYTTPNGFMLSNGCIPLKKIPPFKDLYLSAIFVLLSPPQLKYRLGDWESVEDPVDKAMLQALLRELGGGETRGNQPPRLLSSLLIARSIALANLLKEKAVAQTQESSVEVLGPVCLPNQSIYWGTWKGGSPEGYGLRFVVKQDSELEGVYEGDHNMHGMSHGVGRWITAQYHVCTGHFRENQPHGWAEWRGPDGGRFWGNWNEGKKHGQGEEIIGSIEKPNIKGLFSGMFTENKPAFPSRTFYSDSSVQTVDSKGKTKYEFQTGHIYVGQVAENRFNGQGTLFSPEGLIMYEGEWFFGKKEGFGKASFKGEKGQVVTYEGYWMEGQQHGQGKISGYNSKVMDCEFNHGKLSALKEIKTEKESSPSRAENKRDGILGTKINDSKILNKKSTPKSAGLNSSNIANKDEDSQVS